jgi:Ion channel
MVAVPAPSYNPVQACGSFPRTISARSRSGGGEIQELADPPVSRYGVAIIGFMAESSRMDPNRRLPVSDAYELRTTVRRVRNALSALGVITVVGVLGYMFLEGWGFIDTLYMNVITLTTVGYREVRDLDTTGQLWTMALLITRVGTLFYAAVTSVELAVEGRSAATSKGEG